MRRSGSSWRRLWFLTLALGAAQLVAGAENTDHQRVAAVVQTPWSIEAGVTADLVPLGLGAWDLAVAPRLALTWDGAWSLTLSRPYAWSARPEGFESTRRWGDTVAQVGWVSAPGGFRVRGTLGASGGLDGSPDAGPVRLLANLGLTLARDPALVGLGVSASAPVDGTPWTGSGSFSYQEVVNDAVVWTLSIGPRFTTGTPPATALLVSWGVGWYEGPWGLSTSASTGTGAPWVWSGDTSWTWR